MLRDKWKIQRTAADLAAAALVKQQHHWDRKKWWEEQYKKAMDEAKSNGIEVIESDAKQYSTSNGFGPRIGISPEYQLRIGEADQKVKLHETQRALYASWVELLEASSGLSYELDVDDYQFFFGK